jgi:predicted helicase
VALEWVIDRYKVTTDKKSGIVNDPNAWLREQENPRYVVDLISSLVTVSLETQRLIAELPEFEVLEPESPAEHRDVLPEG